ncbi:hypothetical protein F441_05787 [Phytophthora nicotianae CJ01A1]|uniref:Uncharacterized protein n=4 Tax=Phytophthora nicotianae TaxID=4792 RepID=V9FK01_PHYNI|nr:hypothetical protein F443_05781 [Phytophthora nicotianae P1569]ETK90621.1 hypothetical protein L915_05649 [Phytophthora nicotianae]ETO79448.1 hypothetical protein F444_05831 [Phytophthora nicotianae P1976]ETP20509.1 hypothetical protein F441_05787 [Phytophthora nicotianae CJ01A1]ETL44031.1 hypothetical protein L916_05587 [Phytophthora nicotianae]
MSHKRSFRLSNRQSELFLTAYYHTSGLTLGIETQFEHRGSRISPCKADTVRRSRFGRKKISCGRIFGAWAACDASKESDVKRPGRHTKTKTNRWVPMSLAPGSAASTWRSSAQFPSRNVVGLLWLTSRRGFLDEDSLPLR